MRELYKEIGETVHEHMDNNRIKVIDLGRILCGSFGITEDSARSYISTVRQGYLKSTHRYKDEGADLNKSDWERIARLLQAVGVSAYDEIIGKIKQKYNGFAYPPDETEIKDKKAERLEDYVNRLKSRDRIILTNIARNMVDSYENKESDNLK